MTRRPIARLRTGLTACLAATALLGFGTAWAAPSPAPATAATLAQARVAAIARRLLLANPSACGEQRRDYGLVTGPATATSWGAPVTMVWPNGPAAAAGLQPGDLVRTIGGVPWSADQAERDRFVAALAQMPRAPQTVLQIERAGGSHTVALIGQTRCHAEIRLSAQPFVNATAVDTTIVIGGGLERLLDDDAELAFAVAHEVAHIVLGHTAADRRAEIGDRARRAALERDADAFAVRLMSAAGYPAGAAPVAWAKIADASRPPLARLMDLHGPYMSTAARTAFLAAEAARAASAPTTEPLPLHLSR